MQVTDKFNLLPPSICIVCETQPDGKVIDTLYNLRTGVASALNGRKYVCDRCVEQMAGLLGFEQGEKVKQAKIDVEFAQRQLANFRARVVEMAQSFEFFANHPGAGEVEEVEIPDSPAAQAAKESRKPEVEEVFPPEPEVKGGTTQGVAKITDSETPSVPSPAAHAAGVDNPEETPEEPAPKKKSSKES